LNPLAYEVLIAHQDQPSKDIGDNAECVALVIQKSQEWQQEGVRRYSELWSKKTGRSATQKNLIEHQAFLVSFRVHRVLHSEPSGEGDWIQLIIFQQYYELRDGKGRRCRGLYTVLGFSEKTTGAGIGSFWRYLLRSLWWV